MRKFFITSPARPSSHAKQISRVETTTSYVNNFIPRCMHCYQPAVKVPDDEVNSLDEVEALQCKRTCCCLMCPRLVGDVVRGGVRMAMNPCQTAKRMVKASMLIAVIIMLWPLFLIYFIAACWLKRH